MSNRTLAIALTPEQRRVLEEIAKERYGGNIGRAIRAGLETVYPVFKDAKKVRRYDAKLKV